MRHVDRFDCQVAVRLEHLDCEAARGDSLVNAPFEQGETFGFRLLGHDADDHGVDTRMEVLLAAGT